MKGPRAERKGQKQLETGPEVNLRAAWGQLRHGRPRHRTPPVGTVRVQYKSWCKGRVQSAPAEVEVLHDCKRFL